MLAPQGFTSLASLWAEFQNKRAREVLKEACRTYTHPKFLGGANFGLANEIGSPMDFLEDVFIQSVGTFDLHLCDTNGPQVETPAQLASGDGDLFRRMTVFESTVYLQGEADRADDPVVRRMGSNRFKAWPHKLGDPVLWRDAYPVPSTLEEAEKRQRTCAYHKLPMCFERDRFTICSSLPPWSVDALDDIYVHEDLPKVFGLTICLAKHDTAAWRASYIDRRNYRSFFPCSIIEEKSVGRPRKQELAIEYCVELYPTGTYPPLKVIIADLLEKYEFQLSEETLRRALSHSRGGQNSGQK